MQKKDCFTNYGSGCHNYLYKISFEILECIYNIKLKEKLFDSNELDPILSVDKTEILDDLVSDIEELFLYNFLIMIREYIKILSNLFSNNEYKKIKLYVEENTKFLSLFFDEKDGHYKKIKSILSYPLHNFNEINYNSKCDDLSYESMIFWRNFKNVIKTPFELIKNEFQEVVHLFCIIDNENEEKFNFVLDIDDSYLFNRLKKLIQ